MNAIKETRAERRRREREQNKTRTFKYADTDITEKELINIIKTEAKREEEKYYHFATKLLITASIHALKKEFKFGKGRLERYIDSITEVYSDVSASDNNFKKYNQEVLDMGIEINFMGG